MSNGCWDHLVACVSTCNTSVVLLRRLHFECEVFRERDLLGPHIVVVFTTDARYYHVIVAFSIGTGMQKCFTMRPSPNLGACRRRAWVDA